MLFLPKISSGSGTFKIYNMILVLGTSMLGRDKFFILIFLKPSNLEPFSSPFQTFWKRFIMFFQTPRCQMWEFSTRWRKGLLIWGLCERKFSSTPRKQTPNSWFTREKKRPRLEKHLKNQTTINCWGFKMLVFLDVTSKRPSISQELRKSRKNHGVVFFLGWRFKGSSPQRFKSNSWFWTCLSFPGFEKIGLKLHGCFQK